MTTIHDKLELVALVAVRRWQQFTGKQAVLESTGEPFPSTEASHGHRTPYPLEAGAADDDPPVHSGDGAAATA